MRPGHRRRLGQHRPRRHRSTRCPRPARPSSAAGSRSTTAARAGTRPSPRRGSGPTTSFVGAVGRRRVRRAGPRRPRRPKGSTSPGSRTLAGMATGVALILVDAHGENIIAVACGANGPVTPDQVRGPRAPARRQGRRCRAGGPRDPDRGRRRGAPRAAGRAARRRSSTRRRRPGSTPAALALADIVTPNEGELAAGWAAASPRWPPSAAAVGERRSS